jgi:hypothetical protein
MSKPKTIRLDTLHPDPRNPRTIKGEAFDTLCRLVARYPKFMALRPIVIDADGRIVAGTQRHKALLKNGMTEIPAEWVRSAADLTPEELKAFQVVDNVNAGEFDMEMLTADWEIPDLEAMGIDCGGMKDEAGKADEEPKAVKPPRASISFPARVWLTQRAEIIAAFQPIVEGFGGVAEWPE